MLPYFKYTVKSYRAGGKKEKGGKGKEATLWAVAVTVACDRPFSSRRTRRIAEEKEEKEGERRGRAPIWRRDAPTIIGVFFLSFCISRRIEVSGGERKEGGGRLSAGPFLPTTSTRIGIHNTLTWIWGEKGEKEGGGGEWGGHSFAEDTALSSNRLGTAENSRDRQFAIRGGRERGGKRKEEPRWLTYPFRPSNRYVAGAL